MVEETENFQEGSEETEEDKLANDEMSPEEEGFLKGYEEEAQDEEDFGIDSDPDNEE